MDDFPEKVVAATINSSVVTRHLRMYPSCLHAKWYARGTSPSMFNKFASEISWNTCGAAI
eukprot:4151556-Amphidinium_carterae.2